ncbi:aldehyde dehydrogenase family protein [Amaricoccus solimangrovi]|uniref:Aldehyde dehydrogenase family protein n=1 Tax=Amaricoccus solimangrovi TaxID=2589815 RepID=A0A501WZQ3_9RHOB|nr:aldehyde dehydrogenase family protein [Amaricoccus solimangrovi]TPE53267.1 aldehyde dehydrogenase family protein [Amaricoccus solimangrovi]
MDHKMLIDGRLVSSDRMLDVVNPATETVFARVPHATEAQLDEAVAAARAAQKKWAELSMAQRRERIEALAAAIGENADDLARTITQEQGKPLAEARGEVEWAQGYLAHTATLELPDRVIQDDAQFRIETRHKPLGVVGGIVAWNFPLLLCCWKIGPALMAGNAIVLKPAPTTPVSALKLGELCARVFPAGLVNILTDDNDLGPKMTAHPGVAKIGFTGSSETGKRIAAGAAATMKRVTLEMGGNDPAIVLPDVDVRRTAEKVYGGAFLNAGQVCLAVKRAYVHDEIYDEFCDALADFASQAIVDDGLKQGTTIGPIQNKAQYEKVKGHLEDARNDGTIIAGGEVRGGSGYFISPTIVRDVRDGQRIVDEEQFGPILPVIRFTEVDAVIDRINSSDYGLGGSVHSADVEKAAEIAGRIESGTIWVNQQLNIGPHIPMAGFKGSGLGVEQSVEGLAEYTQMQVINIARG